MIVEFHPEAAHEFIETAAYYESAAAQLGSRFILAVEAAEALISAHNDSVRKLNLASAISCSPSSRTPSSIVSSPIEFGLWLSLITNESRATGLNELRASQPLELTPSCFALRCRSTAR